MFEKLNLLIYYLETNWSKTVAEKFLLKFYKCVDNIAYNPKVGMQTIKDKKVRKYIITKHNTLYYQIDNNRIELLTIFFNKTNPIKNIFE